MKRSPRPFAFGIERLEDRSLPTTFGIPWADPGHLTLSFVPDGTQTPLGPSATRSSLGAAASTATWQREVLRGFQSWAAVANVNIGLVADGGQPLGTSGQVQGDARFGDARIAAAPLSSGVIGSASPFSWTGTTYSGDVVFNSGMPFRVGNVAGTYDVYSVAVHEAGHVFGLDHADAAGSSLDETYAYHTGLAASDVAAMQAMYGARTPDANDAVASNGTTATASAMKASGLAGLAGRLVADGDLSTRTDVDVYRFSTLPTLSLTSVFVRLQADGLSLLTPKVTVLNSAGKVVASGASIDPQNNDLTLKFTNSLLGGTYYVTVEGASGDVFDVGSYRLTVDTVAVSIPIPLLNGLLSPVTDGHLNDTLTAATTLISPPTKTDARFDATYRGAIEDSGDTDNYKLRVPQVGGTGPLNLNVMVWGTNATPLNPRLRVFDANGKPVAFTVLANDTGLFSVEVGGVTAGATYYLSVAARTPGAAQPTGGYFLGVNSNRLESTAFDTVAGNTVAAGTTQTGTLAIAQAGIFEFALAASANGGAGVVTMTVLDAAGRVVFTLSSTANQPLTTAVRYLAAGTYTVRYSTSGTSAPVRYDLFLLQLSDDVGPYASTTTTQPASPPPVDSSGSSGGTTYAGSTGYTYTGSSTSPMMGPPTYY